MRRRILQYLAIAILGAALASLQGCGATGSGAAPGGGGESATPVPLEISFNGTPEGSTPVGVITGNIADIIRTNAAKAATTGLKLGSVSSSSFESSDSYMACTALFHAQFSFEVITDGDVKLCTVQKIVDNQNITVSDIADATLVYDITGSDAIDKIQLTGTVDSDGNVTAYTFHSCNDGVQTAYNTLTLTDTSSTNKAATLTSVTRISQGGFSGHHRGGVTGTVDSNGVWQDTKTITSQSKALSTLGSTSYLEGTLTQTSSRLTFTGSSANVVASSSNCSGSGVTETSYDTQVFFAQLIDHNTSSAKESYTAANLAIGDGAAKGSRVTTCDSTVFDNILHTESWDGDSQAEVASNDLTTNLTGQTLPDRPTITDQTFVGDEIFDCSTEATATIAAGTIDCSNRESLTLSKGFSCENLAGANGLTVRVEDSLGWVGGTTTSTRNTMSTSDVLKFVFSKAVQESSLTTGITLTNTTTSTTVDLGTPTQSTSGTDIVYTYSVTLTSGHEYTLTVINGTSGVLSDPSNNTLSSYNGTALNGSDLTLYIDVD